MLFPSVRRPLLSALLCLLAFLPVRAAHAQDRVRDTGDFHTRAALSGHRPAWATASRDAGPVPDNTPLRLVVALSRPADKQAAFTQLLADLQNPASPSFHHWLTPQQIGEQFGPSEHDLAVVTSWLAGEGLTVEKVQPSRTAIEVSGSAALVANAFQTQLRRYTYTSATGTRNLQAPTAEPTLPAALAPVVSFIDGLAELPLYAAHSAPITASAAQLGRQTDGAHAEIDLGSGSVVYHWLGAADFATIYDLNTAYAASNTGAGQKIMILGGSRLSATDVTNYESANGLTAFQPSYIIPTGLTDPGVSTASSYGDQIEAMLDFTRAYGTAPGAGIDFVISSNWLSGSTLSSLIQYSVNSVVDPVFSLSIGACERGSTAATVQYFDQLFAQAAAEGVTTVFSSGDSGVAGCETGGAAPPATQYASINLFCASTSVTCVGGTEFNDNPTATYWSTTNGTAGLSAKSYIPEGAWNEYTGSGNTPYVVAATGGGPSTVIAKPSWQTGTGVPQDGFRDTPDVSFNAAGHNAYFMCLTALNTNCSTYFTGVGGTSASAPSMAGVAALLNQKLGARQGNITPLLYSLFNGSSSANIFHDATVASSGVSTCSTATPSLCNNSTPSASTLTGGLAGYALQTGYDLATGLGSLDVSNFLTAAAGSPTVTKVGLTVTPSTTSLTLAAGATTGNTVTLAVSGTNAAGLAVTQTCSVTYTGGTTSYLPTCSLSPSSLTLSASGTSSSTLTIGSQARSQFTRASAPLPGPTSGLAAISLASLLAILLPRRKRLPIRLAALALVLAAVSGALTGCGSSGSNSATPTPITGTPAGTYTVTVTSSATGVASVTTNITLIVQ